MRRFLRSDWNFSSTAEPATAVMLAAIMFLAFLRLV
jgi:hypothetical protein